MQLVIGLIIPMFVIHCYYSGLVSESMQTLVYRLGLDNDSSCNCVGKCTVISIHVNARIHECSICLNVLGGATLQSSHISQWAFNKLVLILFPRRIIVYVLAWEININHWSQLLFRLIRVSRRLYIEFLYANWMMIFKIKERIKIVLQISDELF